ncbi:unnamed protein product [Adineta ricciae]|nr:unnamed protein product [Adineta ricciae]
MVVQSQFMPAADLHVIHLKQVVPEEILLEPPYLGADLYPKAKLAWYRKKRVIILMGVLLLFAITGIVVGSVLGTRSRVVDTLIRWDERNWAYSCDFPGNNLANVSSSPPSCGPKCNTMPNCTHFTWSNYNTGTCFLKYGNVTKQDAVFKNDQTMICGIV